MYLVCNAVRGRYEVGRGGCSCRHQLFANAHQEERNGAERGRERDGDRVVVACLVYLAVGVYLSS